jgi:hypothetical protein
MFNFLKFITLQHCMFHVDDPNSGSIVESAPEPAPEPAVEPAAEPAPSAANAALSGTHKVGSAFDSVFGEDVKFSDPTVSDWVQRQKDGSGLEKGLAGMISQMGKKGFERPSDDAADDVKEAFNSQLRSLNGIPEDIADYKVTFAEDSPLGEDIQKAITEWGHEQGIPPSAVEQFLPFNDQLNEQITNQHVELQTEKAIEMFGSKEAFEEGVEDLHEYIDGKGYDFDDPTFRNAQAWKMAQDMRAMEAEIAELKGEDPAIQSGDNNSSSSGKEAIESRINEILYGEDNADFMDASKGERFRALNAEYLQLVEDLTKLAKK